MKGIVSGESVIRPVVLAVLLIILWLLMSGIYKPLVISLGLFSAILCAFIVHHLGLFRHSTFLEDFKPLKILRYGFWLTVEIGKADWAVTKVILSKDLPKRQRLIFVPADQNTEHGKMMFGNSITITPGTVTVETERDKFLVHALTDEAADKTALAEMGRRVCAIEKTS